MCMDGLVQLLMIAKPRTRLIRTNRNAYFMPLLNRIYSINLDKNTYKLH